MGFNELLENTFCLLLAVEALCLQKVVKMLEEAVVGKRSREYGGWQSFMAQFVQILKCWVLTCAVGCFHENWAHAVDQCWLQALQFLVYLINLLNVLCRCNGFTKIQKAVADRQATDRKH